MSNKAEKLQDAIGLIKDEYIEEAHADEAVSEQAATGESGNVIPMPAKRKRRAAGPIAIAACLVIALGVGAFALVSAPTAMEEAVLNTETPRETSAADDMASSMALDAKTSGEEAGAMEGTANSYNLVPGTPEYPQRQEGEAFILTGAEWNDNENWPFFMNLVNSGTISFPTFGIDPTHRVKATIVNAAGDPLSNETVELRDIGGTTLWSAKSNKDGCAYLFYREGQLPAYVTSNGSEQYFDLPVANTDDGQAGRTWQHVDDVTLIVNAPALPADGLQVMFIVDTTGSMSDEIAYLQKDFASIAGDVGSDGIEYSVNFYRDKGDEYVTKCNGFTNNVAKVQALLNDEYADGGGDTPEAVAQILDETITNNDAWRDDCNKVAFLIFDAPPHDGTDDVIDAAVRNAAARGIRLVPVVASNAERSTELFGRALAICTGGTYVFLTDDSGVGESHLEPIVGDYTVELLHDVIVRIINDNR